MIKKIFTALLILFAFTVQASEARVSKKIKKQTCKPVYTVKSDINEGTQIVKCGKTYGVRNAFSFVVIPPEYKKMINIDDTLLKVKKGKNQWGILSYLGHTLVKPQYHDIAVAKIQLGDNEPDYLYFGKVKKTWYFLKNGKEIQLIKTKRGELWEPVFRTTLHSIPHEVTVDENKYRLLMGKMDMGDLLMNTQIKVYVSSKLPAWADYKIADLALISLFEKK